MRTNDLSTLKSKLELEGLAVELREKNNNLPFQHLSINLGLDKSRRPLEALLWLFKAQNDEKVNSDLFMHFFVTLPFSYDNESFISTARYLHLLNKMAVFAGFGLSEPEKGLFFKYTLCFHHGQIKGDLITHFTGAFLHFYHLYSHTLESIASGHITFEDLKKQLNE